MPLCKDIKKVLVIGSGPIVIGQAAEFDYSGTQACKAIKEEGLEVVLINSNPATIMTDKNIADRVYIEPLTLEFLSRIIEKEKPDGLIPTMGGQIGLNLGVELAEKGILDKYGVKLLGTNLKAIQTAEDRNLFRQLLKKLEQPVVESEIVSNLEKAKKFLNKVGLPIIIRPAYTLGGSGGGIAYNEKEFIEIVSLGLKRSRINQVILERNISGWKEIEYEVIRDSQDNCIIVCNMENIDPVGVHTGDSIVVAPGQTLSNKEYQLLRSISMKIIRALKIEGGCNIQFALSPDSMDYYIIEVNPRVSRSSALASKATGYPIAQVSTKIALGLHLDEIKNQVSRKTYACYEPTLDYVVCKIPRWPFDKFPTGDRRLGTQMKATGEVMSIGRNFSQAFLKALDSLDLELPSFQIEENKEVLLNGLKVSCDDRIFYILQSLYNNISIGEIHQITKVDKFYLHKFAAIIRMVKKIERYKGKLDKGKLSLEKIVKCNKGKIKKPSDDSIMAIYDQLIDVIGEAKKTGFNDQTISRILGLNPAKIRQIRKNAGIKAVYKMVDTCAGEFEADTPYYYSTYLEENELKLSDRKKILVIGSGPIRIGQGIEFDYSSVHAVKALQEEGIEAIIINNNPETVSTDFDTADKLYFEPITGEYVLNIVEAEKIKDVILQFGGQTAISLAETLSKFGVNILGTDLKIINMAENREEFINFMKNLNIPTPKGITAYKVEEAMKFTRELGYPVLVRPSFVLGGRGMEIVFNEKELKHYLAKAVRLSPNYPVLIDHYITGKEVEVDAIADGKNVLIPGIMEHIEKAGIHSGDSMAVYPAQSLSSSIEEKLTKYTNKIVQGMNLKGLINIQFVIDEDNNIYVIEVNPRASRTVPILSKATDIPMVKLAIKVMLGSSLEDICEQTGLLPPSKLISVKSPVFSFDKLKGVDIHLSPEMKSTGEVLGTANTLEKAVYKSLLASNFYLPEEGNILFSLADRDKEDGIELARSFISLGFRVLASEKTGEYFCKSGLELTDIIYDPREIQEKNIDMLINTPTKGKNSGRMGFKLRRIAVEFNIPCYTSLDTVRIILQVLAEKNVEEEIYSLDEYYQP